VHSVSVAQAAEHQAIARTRWVTRFDDPVDAERCSGFRVVDGVSAIIDGWIVIYDRHQEKHVYDNGFWQPTGEMRVIAHRGPCVLTD
jgi:hypothetical protein